MQIRRKYKPGPIRSRIEDASGKLGPEFGGNILNQLADIMVLNIHIIEALAVEVGVNPDMALGNKRARTPDKILDGSQGVAIRDMGPFPTRDL